VFSRRPDATSRAAALGLAVGRLAIGTGATLATRRALAATGFGETDGAGRALARMTGARDLALAGLVLTALDDRRRLRAATAAAAFADAADAAAFGVALARRDGIDRAGAVGVVAASAATTAGLWLHRRLGRRLGVRILV
jgi:hypothetical protein